MTSRPYLKIIQDCVKEDGITFDEITPDFVYRVKSEGKQPATFLMLDTEIGLNNSASSKIAISKSSAFNVLSKAKIKAVPHLFLKQPNSRFNTGDSYLMAGDYFRQFEKHVVIKPDNGSQGEHVYKIADERTLMDKLKYLFSLEKDVALSPYFEAYLEYRIVTLCHEPRLFLAKEKSNSWKHNLVQGAIVKEPDTSVIPLLSEMAAKASKALGLDFCSVDILETNDGLFVIEVNDKVMLDEYTKQVDPHRRKKVQELYRAAILERLRRQAELFTYIK